MTNTEARAATRHRRAWGISAGGTLIWLIAVLATDSGGRVFDNWASALTMLIGSFLAGSSPEGGGAVAFPIFTKGLHVAAPVARTFGLSIQAVGMTVAAVSIVLFRRAIHVRAAVVATIAALGGFALAVAAFGEPDGVFWPSSIGTPWVKATFSVLLATTSLMMIRHLRHGPHGGAPLAWNHRLDAGLAVAAAGGGFVSALTGTRANIMVFLFLVVLVDVSPRVALPTAIMVMAAVSIVGFVLFGLIDGQLDVAVTDGIVTSVGGTTTALKATESDLFGLWLAAVPIVVWGAPLGSLAAAMVPEKRLVQFVALLATTEVATTFILVSELRSEPALLTFLIAGLVFVPTAFLVLQRHRHAVFGD